MKQVACAVLALSTVSALVSNAPYMVNTSRPLVLGHRGSPGLFPEHSKQSYINAYIQGVDFVELDLQVTKDGQLVTNHDPTLKESTNIELYSETYADRKGNFNFSQYTNQSNYVDDWLIHDFDLVELKTLRRKQRYSRRNGYMNDLY